MAKKPNPYNVPTISKLMRWKSDPPGQSSTIISISASTDCFGMLPAEIRTEISTYLETADMLHLRLASRVMATVFYSQPFWKSRFRIDRDRGYLAYLVDDAKRLKKRYRKTNWMCLYHVTNRSRSDNYREEINLRESIWNKNKWFQQTTTMVRGLDISPPADYSGMEVEMTENWEWKELQADVRRDNCYRPYRLLCSPDRMHTQYVHIPQSVEGIGISILQEMDVTYITGLELFCRNHRNITVGYKIPGAHVIVDVTDLRGFTVAMSSGGIRALQLVTRSQATKWLGLLSDGKYCFWKSPYLRTFISKRLIFEGNIEAIRCTFNVGSIIFYRTIFDGS